MTDWVTNHDTALLQAPDRLSKQLKPVPAGTAFKGTVKDGFIETTIGGLSGYILHFRANTVPTSPDSMAPEEFELFRDLVTRTAEAESTDPTYLLAVAYAGTNNLTNLGGPGDGKVGPFQFTAQEWNAAITTGPAKGVDDPPLRPEDRFSWRLQPRVAALLAADCVKGLQAPTALGRLPTRLELYFAQLFGPGAEQLLKKPLTDLCKTAIQGTPAAGTFAAELASSDQSIGDALDKLRTRLATGLVATGLIDTGSEEASKSVDAPTGTGAARPGTDTLAKQAFDILVGLGWSKAQACGILANIQAESNFNHTISGDGGAAYGLCQWHPDRQARFAQKFKPVGIKSSTFKQQVEFIDAELRTSGWEKKAGDALQNVTAADQAGEIVSLEYERPREKQKEAKKRAGFAEKWFSRFGA